MKLHHRCIGRFLYRFFKELHGPLVFAKLEGNPADRIQIGGIITTFQALGQIARLIAAGVIFLVLNQQHGEIIGCQRGIRRIC